MCGMLLPGSFCEIRWCVKILLEETEERNEDVEYIIIM